MHRSNKVYWQDHDHWICCRHLPAGVLPATIDRCWLCPNKRPKMADRPAPPKGVKPGTLPGPKKKQAPRSLKPRMIVTKKLAPIDGLASVTAAPPPTRAPLPKKRASVVGSSKTMGKAATKSKPATKAAAKKAAAMPTAQVASPAPQAGQCHWHECSETARPRSKYCSRNCSNKNARSRHKARK